MRTNYSAEELSNIARLRELREFHNFNITDMERVTGISWSSLSRIEKGKSLPSPKAYNKLAFFFGWANVNVSPKKRTPARKLDITPEFVIGHVYSIKDRSKGKRYDEPVFDIEYFFRFDGRQGGLLCFTEINGGWTRSYAPYQMVGKRITEVRNVSR